MKNSNLYNGYVYCDLDGTLIECDLERAFIQYLLREKQFKIKNYALAAFSIPFNRLRKKTWHGDILKSWPAFRKSGEIDGLIDSFLKQPGASICINKAVMRMLQEYTQKGFKIVLLTASFERLVIKFLKYKNINNVFDEVIGSQMSESHIVVKQMPYGKDKCNYILEANTVGIANEYADRFYLMKCDQAAVYTKDERLLELAKAKGWEII